MFRRNTLLWVIQGLLASLFLFAGGAKLALPLEALKGPIELPGVFLRFIGVCEVAGAIGLIVPWLTGIRRGLTPLAASGLVIIMTGATVLTIVGMGAASALVPAIAGALAASVALGRRPARGGALHAAAVSARWSQVRGASAYARKNAPSALHSR